ncbi:MAG: hypothetical protein ABSH51_32155 [Solirubrobacteraceae bacterium]|jgi:hypothetical protein
MIEEEDDFIVDPKTGANVAVVTAAPAGQCASLSAEFAAIRQSQTLT